MSTTVFCTFERQDFADMAVGSLHESGLGIKSIHYIGERRQRENPALTNMINIFPGLMSHNPGADAAPPRPVTLKIVCPDEKSDALIAKLINLHGYEIIKTR